MNVPSPIAGSDGSPPRPDETFASTEFLLRSSTERDLAARKALREIKVRRPIDLLVSRLEEEDGERWFEDGFDDEPLNLLGSPREVLQKPNASVDVFRTVKNKSKRLHKLGVENSDPELRQRGLCGYFLTISAALVHHRVLLSSLPQAELRDILLELASALPSEWSEFLERAADVEGWTRC